MTNVERIKANLDRTRERIRTQQLLRKNTV
jgi:hypothetical protein